MTELSFLGDLKNEIQINAKFPKKSLAALNNVALKYRTVCANHLDSLQQSLRRALSNVYDNI